MNRVTLPQILRVHSALMAITELAMSSVQICVYSALDPAKTASTSSVLARQPPTGSAHHVQLSQIAIPRAHVLALSMLIAKPAMKAFTKQLEGAMQTLVRSVQLYVGTLHTKSPLALPLLIGRAELAQIVEYFLKLPLAQLHKMQCATVTVGVTLLVLSII